MFFTGFADEASPDFATQIKATKELGWNNIEARNIGGKMLGTMSDEEFEKVEQLLAESGVKINCYGSAIANWSRHPRKEEDFEASKQELLTALPRMKKLGIKLVRGMSFLVPKDEPGDSPELEKIIFRKVRELVQICADNGVVYGHENCMNYGGMSHLHTLKLVEQMNGSPAFTLIFDTGNPVFNPRRIGPKPWPIQSAWEFYKRVRPYVSYVHIKDGLSLPNEAGDGCDAPVYTFAGDGCGDVRAIMTDLLKTGYDGGFSMEPHLGAVFHDPSGNDNTDTVRKYRYDVYVEYGRRFMQLLRDCGWKF
ncbi:MAG: sugar phosphate isomerase/epimerase [Victivallales bacterium]|nr:sugar phosphate isomerase/epimerase [Victivallales bacterium]